MPKTEKVVVTNEAALRAKYGAAYAAKIKPAIAALIAADKARGLTTGLIAIDAQRMAKFKAKPVAKASDVRQCKSAIDALYAALSVRPWRPSMPRRGAPDEARTDHSMAVPTSLRREKAERWRPLRPRIPNRADEDPRSPHRTASQ